MKDAESHETNHHAGESRSLRLWRKMEESPSVPIGVMGLLATIGRKAYGFKNRGGMSTSVYFMHLRVQAQAMVIGGITLGVTYGLIEDMLKKARLEALKNERNNK